MNIIRKVGILCALTLVFCPVATTARTKGFSERRQQDDTTTGWRYADIMRSAIHRVVGVAHEQEQKNFYFIAQGCFFGTVLANKQTVQEGFELQKGFTYAFLAGGDDTVEDISLVLSKEGETIKHDTSNTHTAVVVFICKQTARYTITLSLNNAQNEGAFCCLSVLQKPPKELLEHEKNSISSEALTGITEACLRKCALMNKLVPARFHMGQNTWAVIGVNLKPQQNVGSDLKMYEATDHTLIGAASTNSRGISCHWLDDNGNIVASQENIDLTPGFIWRTRNERYTIGIANNTSSSNPSSLIVVAILDQPGISDVLAFLAAAKNSRMKFRGYWRDTVSQQQGTLTFFVQSNNDVIGLVSNQTNSLQSKIRGSYDQGRLNFRYRYGDQRYTAQGSIWTNRNGSVGGTLDFFDENGRLIGRAKLTLQQF